MATMSSSASSARASTRGPDSPPPGYDEPLSSYDDGAAGVFMSETIYNPDFPGQVIQYHMRPRARTHAHALVHTRKVHTKYTPASLPYNYHSCNTAVDKW